VAVEVEGLARLKCGHERELLGLPLRVLSGEIVLLGQAPLASLSHVLLREVTELAVGGKTHALPALWWHVIKGALVRPRRCPVGSIKTKYSAIVEILVFGKFLDYICLNHLPLL